MDGAKIRVKVGAMELEYEGDPAFLKDGLEELLTTMAGLAGNTAQSSPDDVPATSATSDSHSGGEVAKAPGSISASTNTIAAHLGGGSGPELIICAVAQLELVQGKAGVSRSEILAEMKGATNYYNGDMSKNLTSNLASLTKAKRLNHLSGDRYSLTAPERQKVEEKVADIG